MTLRSYQAAVLVGALVVYAYAAPLVRGQSTTPTGPAATTSPVTTVSGTLPTVTDGQPSQSVVAVTTVPSPAEPQHVPEQVIWALAMSYAMEFVKKKRWLAFLTPESTARIKAGIGFLVSTSTAAGIHFAITGSLMDGSGAAITITGLSMSAFKDIGFQWIAQQGWYDLVVKKA